MSEEKKTAVTEEVKKEVRKLTEEELEQVTGGFELRDKKYKIQHSEPRTEEEEVHLT